MVTGIFSKDDIQAAGGFANESQYNDADENFGAGVTTREGAMVVMDIAESAISLLNRIRSDIGSVQLQLEVTLNNISVTQVNVKAAESGIRDVDFGTESANFSKQNILAQSGSYALSQANAIQQHVLRLLQ
jgi:flagellin